MHPWVKDEDLLWVSAHSSALWCFGGEGQSLLRQQHGSASPPHCIAYASEGLGAFSGRDFSVWH